MAAQKYIIPSSRTIDEFPLFVGTKAPATNETSLSRENCSGVYRMEQEQKSQRLHSLLFSPLAALVRDEIEVLESHGPEAVDNTAVTNTLASRS